MSQATLAWRAAFGNPTDTVKGKTKEERANSEGENYSVNSSRLVWLRCHCLERFSAKGLHKGQQSCGCCRRLCYTAPLPLR